MTSVTIVQDNQDGTETEVRFTSEFGVPMARHFAEVYCKKNRVKIITKRPTIGRIACDKNNVVWHVTGLPKL